MSLPFLGAHSGSARLARTWLALAVSTALVAAGLGWWSFARAGGLQPITIGAVFPLRGNAAGLAGQELLGVQIARDMVNAAGGIDGRPIRLEVRDLESAQDAPAIMASLGRDGVSVVIGAYSSALSIDASTAAANQGLVYWEAGAVADQLTGRGLPMVFRVGASGTNLGTNSASFAASALAPRLGKPAADLRLAIVHADDAYADSVADAALARAERDGISPVVVASYAATAPDWRPVMARLAAARPDVVILASHIPDGVAFRQAMLAAHVHVSALIGTTMAECDPDFAGALGADAIGIFASDRPTGGFQPSALRPAAREVYRQLAAAWAARQAASPTAAPSNDGWGNAYGAVPWSPDAGAGSAYTITGPVEEGSGAAGPSEEVLSGFTAAWALFHDVLPAANRSGTLSAAGVAAAARNVDLPAGSLPNGAGLRFSTDPATLGQNLLASAVIWQWQAVRSYTFVWPATYATGTIRFVPLGQ